MQDVMRTIIMYVLKGILFLIGMFAVCILFGEPNENIDLMDLVVLKTLAVGVLCGVVLCYFRTMGRKEYDDMMNEEV
jgi:hypothetical protein